MSTDTSERRFRYIERPDGFVVETPFHPPVYVAYDAQGRAFIVGTTSAIFDVAQATEPMQRMHPDRFGGSVRLLAFRTLVDQVVECMLRHTPDHPAGEIRLPHRVRKALLAQKVGPRLYEQRARFLAQLDPQVLAVKKAVFAATLRDDPLTDDPALYAHPYLVADILRYRAAAFALTALETLESVARGLSRYQAPDEGTPLCNTAPLAAFWDQVAERGESRMALLADWRCLFSPTGQPYRSLHRTLDRLPGALGSLPAFLAAVTLPRPITDRTELLALLLYTEAAFYAVRNAYDVDAQPAARPFLFARRDDVCRALARFGRATHQPNLSTRRIVSVANMVRYLFDVGEAVADHRGALTGMVDKAIAAHQRRVWRFNQVPLRQVGPDAPVRAPDVPLPAHPAIRFLDTVQAIAEEGVAMGHCVANYIPLAVRGQSYLFHVEHQGEAATVEVTADGQVRQSYGPHNRVNAASRWGARVLARWGKTLAARPAPALLDVDEIPF